MINQIKSLDGYESLTAQQIADALAALVPKPESFYTFNSLVIALDGNVPLVEGLVAAMRQAGLNASADSLTNRGIDFGLASVPVMLDSLGQAAPELFTSEVVASLKALGQQTRYASLGGSGDLPTADQVTAALARDAIEPIWQAKQAVVNEGIFDGTITTLEQIVDAIGGA